MLQKNCISNVLKSLSDDIVEKTVVIDIDAPFYDDPRPPNLTPGDPFDKVVVQ